MIHFCFLSHSYADGPLTPFIKGKSAFYVGVDWGATNAFTDKLSEEQEDVKGFATIYTIGYQLIDDSLIKLSPQLFYGNVDFIEGSDLTAGTLDMYGGGILISTWLGFMSEQLFLPAIFLEFGGAYVDILNSTLVDSNLSYMGYGTGFPFSKFDLYFKWRLYTVRDTVIQSRTLVLNIYF
jgi:hypothetical protein